MTGRALLDTSAALPSRPLLRPISILLVCDTYPPVLGGSEIEAQRVAAALIQRGHRVRVLCSGGPPMPAVREWTDPAGVPVSILTRRSRGIWKNLAFAGRTAWTLLRDRNRYDVVYFLMQGLHLATGLPAARVVRKPIVMKFSGSSIISLMSGSRVGRLELRWLAKWAGRVMVLNEGMAQEAVQHGLPRELLVWMPNPVNVEQFRPGAPDEAAELRRVQGIPAGAAVVIYVGRLSPEKGLLSLLRSFALARRHVPEAFLLLVGDGPMRRELEGFAANLGLGSSELRFAGRVDVSEVPDWLRLADVFSLVSPNEGFSCALAEAMASGLPSVVTDIPANEQLVQSGRHGLLVAVDDDNAIATALVSLLKDEPLRRRMGAESRRRVLDDYSTSSVIARYESLFADVL